MHVDRRSSEPSWPRSSWLVSLAIMGILIALLRWEGRIWWCACGHWWPWISDVWSSHCSQHLLDPYSFTHLTHGLIFAGVLTLLARTIKRHTGRTLAVGWQFCIAIFVAAAWEVAENSAFVIERYRNSTMSLDYLGDSVVNSIGDVLCCGIGFFVARRLGWARSIVVFVAIELVLLILIRDNLTLNVIMLVWPVKAIRAWQTVGHVPTP